MKRIIMILLAVLTLAGCTPQKEDTGKLTVITTLFPQYDFAKEIAGECADVSLLLPAGVESHSFEPSPSDVIKVNKSDLFIYTSEYMEPWVERMLRDNETKATVLQATSGIVHKEHGGDIDPHVWTNPQNAILMAKNILNTLCEVDSKNSDYYKKNYKELEEKLNKLDRDIEETVNGLKNKKLVFGTKFSLHYFADRYSLEHISAFDSCGHESEPSAKVMAEIIDTVKSENISAVYYGELESTKVAETIAGECGTKTLMLHSCHNVTGDEFRDGATYISLMENNIQNLKEGQLQ